MKFTVYANCQAAPVLSMLNLASSAMEPIRCPAVHTLGHDDITRVREIIGASEVVIHQPVSESFGPLSVDALKTDFPDKKFISFPSIYFGGLFPYLAYLRVPGKGTLGGPFTEYHDTRIIEAFLAGLSIEETTALLDAETPIKPSFFDSCFEESLKRETSVDIPVMGLVKETLLREHAFFTYNHPANSILWHVATEVLGKLGLPNDGSCEPPNRVYLDNCRAAIPADLLRQIGATWRSPDYVLGGKVIPKKEFVTRFFEVYEKVEDFAALCNANQSRFPMPLDRAQLVETAKTALQGQKRTVSLSRPSRGPNTSTKNKEPKMYVSSLVSDLKIGCFSKLLPHYCALEPGLKVCVDGGAGLGETAKKIMTGASDYPIEVVAYEPNPSNVEKFIYKADQVQLVPAALGDQNGTASFLVTDTTKETNHAAFMEKDTSFVGKLENPSDAEQAGTRFDVDVVRMDDNLSSLGIDAAHFVKLDLQGGELPALKGMGDLIDGVHWMWIEYGGQAGLLDFLREKGFVLFDTEYLFVGEPNDLIRELFHIIRVGSNSIGKGIFFGRRKHLWKDYNTAFSFAQRHRRMVQTDIIAVSPAHLGQFLDAAKMAASILQVGERFSIPRSLF